MTLSWNGYLIRLDELVLKGRNRREFEKKLIENILTEGKIQNIRGRLLWRTPVNASSETHLQHIIGIASFSPFIEAPKDIHEIKKMVLELVKEKVKPDQTWSFKIHAIRADKQFLMTSMEINEEVAGVILENYPDAKVNLNSPDIEIGIDLREEGVFLYTDKIPGMRGLPVGTGPRVLTLISGGIDSPVAAWQVMKRGCPTDFVHFFSYPYTSLQSREKVSELVKILMRYQAEARMHVVNFAKIQEEIQKCCHERLRVILYRRSMARIAQAIADKTHAKALVTGESLGQVASQTVENMSVVGQAVQMLMLRPLLTFNKLETITLAKKIGTYEISIRPHDDCCTLFQPQAPSTKARLDDILVQEAKWNSAVLEQNAIEHMETVILSSKNI